MCNILITGASGMLGATLASLWEDKYNIFATDHNNYKNNEIKNFKNFDLLSESYKDLINWSNPDIVVHCAAMTNVDECEDHPKRAMAVNAKSINKILAENNDIKIIFISSDAVFSDGCSMAIEKDEVSPETIYGESKAKAERYLQESNCDYLIIRTTIVGKNINENKVGFSEWIIDSVVNKKNITLFNDVYFTPITIWHLAKEIEWCIDNSISGIVHISGKDSVTKFDFGKKLCDCMGLNADIISKGSVDSVTFKAKRSKDQTLSSSYYERISGHNIPLMEYTVELLAKHFKR